MPAKSKINVKEKVEDNVCDLSLSELKEVPVSEIVSVVPRHWHNEKEKQEKAKKKKKKVKVKKSDIFK